MDSPVRSTTLSHTPSAYNVSRFQFCLTLSHPTDSTDTPILLFRIQSVRDMYLRGVPPDLLHGQRTRKLACPLYRLQIRLCSRPCRIRSSSSWPMRSSTSPCIRQSRRRSHPLWRTRRMSEIEQPRAHEERYVPTNTTLDTEIKVLILWFRCSHENAVWSKVIQDYNTLPS